LTALADAEARARSDDSQPGLLDWQPPDDDPGGG
jgi:hypothetical protein